MSSQSNEFEQLKNESSAGIVREFWQFILENKTWWMMPIMISFSIFGVFIALAATGALPFIYTIF
jgi:hypothetical protein